MTQIEEILGNLISIKTDNKFLSNKNCVDYICSFLQQHNILHKRLLSADGIKENIIAGINIQSFKNINSGIALSGHMDTVGVNIKDWDTNPFQSTNINGAIYGRGTVDMKYFIAIILSMLSELKKTNIPIFLLFSCDEETDVSGIRTITKFMEMRNIHPKFALVGEPTNFAICTSSKGYVGYTTTIKGLSAHSSCPELGVNAAYIAAKVIDKIEELSGLYSSKGTTLNVGLVGGGEGRNLIPSEVAIDWEIRYSQDSHKEEILREINKLHKELSAIYKDSYFCIENKEYLPSFEQNSDSQLVKIGQNILKTSLTSLPHATEAGFLKDIGIETIICGAGDERLAHTSSEHILLSDLVKYKEFLLRMIQEIPNIASDFILFEENQKKDALVSIKK